MPTADTHPTVAEISTDFAMMVKRYVIEVDIYKYRDEAEVGQLTAKNAIRALEGVQSYADLIAVFQDHVRVLGRLSDVVQDMLGDLDASIEV